MGKTNIDLKKETKHSTDYLVTSMFYTLDRNTFLLSSQHWFETFHIFALLTCVCLTAHADVSVTRHLGCLVVRRLILLGNLCVLFGQKGDSLCHVAIAHLQRQRGVSMLVCHKEKNAKL